MSASVMSLSPFEQKAMDYSFVKYNPLTSQCKLTIFLFEIHAVFDTCTNFISYEPL